MGLETITVFRISLPIADYRLPVSEIPAVHGGSLRAALDVVNPARSRVGRGNDYPGCRAFRNRVRRNASQILFLDEVLEAVRILAAVSVVLVDRDAHLREVLLEHCLLRLVRAVKVARHSDRQQQRNDRHDDYKLDECETGEP